jgi:hypothetical protein
LEIYSMFIPTADAVGYKYVAPDGAANITAPYYLLFTLELAETPAALIPA